MCELTPPHVFATLPFVVHPQQVGSQDDGDVPGRHFVHVLMFGQLGEEFDQIPVGTKHRSPQLGPVTGEGQIKGRVITFTPRLEVKATSTSQL